jgi:ABC-2 type transport system ATP-binding protein
MLMVKDLTYHINNKLILNHINISVNKGELIGIVGKNGAGKTTFLECISDLRKISKGCVFINGKSFKDKSNYTLAFISDSPFLYDYLTGEEYLELYSDLYGVKFPKEKLEILIKDLEMEDKMNSLIKTYSKGMRMKIALIGSILLRPHLLLLDEPFNGLDPTSLIRVSNKLKQLCKDGTTVLLSSHSLESIKTLCDRIFHLFNGTMNEISKDRLEEIFN